MKAIRRFTVRVTLPEPLAALHGLMLNLRWSWHAETRDLFAAIDPAGWEASGHDPVALLGEVRSADAVAVKRRANKAFALVKTSGQGQDRTVDLPLFS